HLPTDEITLANVLKGKGYRTMAIGKWHLGHQSDDLFPTGRGFDEWFGLPYSNDMRRPWVQTDIPLKLYRNTTPIESPVDQSTLTERYTEEAIRFIKESGDQPFFIYLAHSMPHLPISTSEKFRGKSESGLYGDVIETLDWSTGRIRETLRDRGIEENTLVIFTSDNGPWLDLPDRMLQEGNKRWYAGSPGPLRGSKGTT
ncbi:MAG: sulfatase-like hydrolase/transferase, partial [Candidatus Omnitrophica bacterium]|nr:sulfatase-like hydrolase/transferase [Candidatus Omnitrophota bacterium]